MDSTATKADKPVEVVVTKKAFNLACSWVQSMSGGADFDVVAETKGLPEDDGAHARPTRLGLGAKYLSHAQASRVSTQVDKKLRAKLVPAKTGTGYQGGRRDGKGRENYEEEAVQGGGHGEDEDEEDDSRASVFKKRTSAFIRPTLIVSETAGSKKKRKGP
ncbi:hypothetical protein M758_6G025600 [Ceratodon purpureus]|nr:hypothetical protein M758_6G025600 [Ceratodon purpureus]